MSILVIFSSFVLLFLAIGVSASKRTVKEILILSVLIFSSLLVFVTEIASSLKLINFWFILTFWSITSLFALAFLLTYKSKLGRFFNLLINLSKNGYNRYSILEKVLFYFVIVNILVILVQGYIYPPNNWDSMTYHMARIPHWISNHSVYHYPTNITRQMYQPPFSGYVILHFNILNKGDFFSNFVQFAFLIFSAVLVLAIVEQICIPERFKLLPFFLIITIPEAILQASSTQNDIIVSFFILASVYFALLIIKESTFNNFFFIGISVGLGLLTKATAYIYLAPLLFVLSMIILNRAIRKKIFRPILYLFISGIIAIGINSGYYSRNILLTSNFLGIDQNEALMFRNENVTFVSILSSTLKNIGLHVGPTPINVYYDSIIRELHNIFKVDINSNNFLDEKYTSTLNSMISEDYASNTLHFYLTILSFISLIHILKNRRAKNSKQVYFLSGVLLLQFMFFCVYLRWQPWHTRLHMPLFFLAVPLIIYGIWNCKVFSRIFIVAIPLLIVYSSYVTVFNSSRPLIQNKNTSKIPITDNRFVKYFAVRYDLYEEYDQIRRRLVVSQYKNVGLILGSNDWEYPIFATFYSNMLHPIHIGVDNVTKNIHVKCEPIDCIVSTTINDTTYYYKGEKFRNISDKNKSIWLYEHAE